ncbi:MAG: PQQ-binding-like beta-propeller repeat protein [Pirellulaceae bacterium]
MIRRSAVVVWSGLLGAAQVLLFQSLGWSENWPQWRGPRNDGSSVGASIPARWDPQKNILWKSPMPGQGGATPVVWGDRIFVTSAQGDDLVVLALSAADGKVLWNTKVASGNQDARAGEGNSASPSPCTDGEHLWVFFSTGILACFDFDGKEIWKSDLNERFGKIDIQFGMTSTPALDGDHLYLQLIHGPMTRGDGVRTGKVIKLDKKTGATVWEVDRVTDADFECKHSYASPFIYAAGEERFLVVHGADCTTGHDLSSGKELWRYAGLNGPSEVNSGQYDGTFRFVASPAVGDGVVIIPTAKRGPTVALDVNEKLQGLVVGGGAPTRWSIPQTPDVAIPTVHDGLVYLLHNDGRLQCIDLKSGEQLYFERTHTSQHRSSPLVADGKLIFCARDGMCTVVKLGRQFEILAQNDLGEPVTASPIVAGGVLYIRTYQHVIAIR